MPYGAHGDLVRLSGRWDRLSIRRGHRLGEGPLHDPYNGGPIPRAEFDCVDLYPGIRGVDKHGLQILDVFLDTLGLVSVGPVYGHVLGVALVQSRPLLPGENFVIQGIEGGDVLGNGLGLGLECPPRRLRSFIRFYLFSLIFRYVLRNHLRHPGIEKVAAR